MPASISREFFESLPESAKEIIPQWQSGGRVWSIELGGLGPGYEQAIQVLIFEIVKDAEPESLPMFQDNGNPTTAEQKQWDQWAHSTIDRLDEVYGYSGAQVSSAKNTAYQFLRYGYRHIMSKVPDDRLIQVSRNFPSFPEIAA